MKRKESTGFVPLTKKKKAIKKYNHEIQEIMNSEMYGVELDDFNCPIKLISSSSGNRCTLIVTTTGQLFIYNDTFRFFEKIDEFNNIKLISCGHEHAVIVNDMNEIFINFSGEIEDDEFLDVSEENCEKINVGDRHCFQKVKSIKEKINIKKVVCGYKTIFIITEDNILYVAGSNYYSRLGIDSDNKTVKTFTKVTTLQNCNIIDLCSDDEYTLILDDLGDVYVSGGSQTSTNKFTKFNISFKVKRICLADCGSFILVSNNEFFYFKSLQAEFIKLNIPPNILINQISYCIFFNGYEYINNIFLTTNNGECYFADEYSLNFKLLTFENKDRYKYFYPFSIDGGRFMLFSDYLINEEEDIGKEVRLFKQKLLKCTLQVTDLAIFCKE